MPVRRLNHAVLYVRDASRSAAFYGEVFDFKVDMEIPGRAVFLSAADTLNDHDLGLFTVGEGAPAQPRGGVGLYHLAWEVGTLRELHEIAGRLQKAGALAGASDHLVSKSLYGKDPDGIEFEVMWRVPREDWPKEEGAAAVLPLDLQAALDTWGPDLATGAAAGSPT
ncbi:VOC family protein [Streptomyces thermolineatus]|uniref:VOC family protein n=1 Tax=Streptomyces thermolineatus TaxID=44033 RepID=A0ABP5ZRN4_9ACTN